jgi:hypothetical protein
MFPETALGQISAAQGLTLSNIGNETLSLTGLFTSGSFAQQGSGSNICSPSTVLAAGADCLVSVAFAPAGGGILTGSLVFTDNALNQPGAQQQVSLLGPWAKAIPSAASLNFGSGAVGSSGGNQWITINNPGDAPLTFSNISISGANAGDFTIDTSEGGTSIPAQTIGYIEVSFTPKDVGTRTASLVLTDNALDSPQTISLTGTGVAPANIVISANNLVFPNQALNTSSPPQTITLTNTGGEGVRFNPLVPFGSDFAFIPQNNSCFYGLLPGETCTFTATFTPTAPGPRTGGIYMVIEPYISMQRTTNTIVAGGYGVSAPALTSKPGDVRRTGDFDGDGKLDYAIWRPGNGTWYIIPSSHPEQPIVRQWGLQGDIPVAGDFDDDGQTDFAVWRPSDGTWYILTTGRSQRVIVQQWGVAGDVPVPGDFDADGQTDFAVWRPSNGTWYVLPSRNPATPYIRQWGVAGDVPVTGDFDGDGKTDPVVWRPANGNWYILPSGGRLPVVQQWGTAGDSPL